MIFIILCIENQAPAKNLLYTLLAPLARILHKKRDKDISWPASQKCSKEMWERDFM